MVHLKEAEQKVSGRGYWPLEGRLLESTFLVGARKKFGNFLGLICRSVSIEMLRGCGTFCWIAWWVLRGGGPGGHVAETRVDPWTTNHSGWSHELYKRLPAFLSLVPLVSYSPPSFLVPSTFRPLAPPRRSTTLRAQLPSASWLRVDGQAKGRKGARTPPGRGKETRMRARSYLSSTPCRRPLS